MTKINRNIMINKAGGNAGKNSKTYRISLPAEIVKELRVTEEDRAVVLEWDTKEKYLKIMKKEKEHENY